MRDLARYRANPLQRGVALLLEAQLHAEAGRRNDALDALERALADGCRYRRDWLEGNAGLASLRDDARFRDVIERADARYAEDAAAARPKLMFAMPDEPPDAFGYPLLVVLHGNNSNASETAPQWSAMADAGWVVAVPQSSEIGMTPDAFTWNDRERTAAELATHLEKVKHSTQIDVGRIVLAGFSMGGLQAIALPLIGKIKVRGIVPVAAWLPHIREFTRLVEGGAGKMLRSYVIVGDQDQSLDGARALADLFTAHGMRTQLDVREGLGHEYPADMHETLARALAFVTAP
jgi:predicted esterase